MADDSEFTTLRASEQRQAFLLKLSDALRPLGDPLDRQEMAARLLGEHLDVNRVGYAELGTSPPTIRREYIRGVAPLAGRGLAGAFGPAFQDAFQRGETVVVSDVRTDPRFSESARAVLGEREIAALVGVTLLKGGQLVAAFGANNATPRDWTSGEVELIRDVAERTWEAVERARAEAALRGSEERLAFLLKLSDALRPLIDPNEMAAAASRLLGEHLRANRVVYADIEGDEFVIRHTFDSGVGRLSGRGPVSCMGAAFLDSYRRGEAIAVHDVRTDASLTERERAGLQRNSIAAFAMSVLLKNGQWVSSLGVHSATPRIWTPSELELIRDVADRTWEALERAHTEAALRLANQELRESEQRFSIIHDRAPFAISLTSVPDGRIVSVNNAFEQLFEFTREELLGKTRVELGISSSALNAELVGELERNGVLRDFEVRRWTKSGVERVLLLSIDPVKIAGRDYLLTTMVDVTDEKHAQTAELERRTAQLSQMASDLTLAEQHAREQLAKTLHDGLQQLLVSASMNLDRQVKREAQRGAGTDALDEVKSHIDEAIAAARSLSFELFPPVLHGSGLPAALAWLADWTRNQYRAGGAGFHRPAGQLGPERRADAPLRVRTGTALQRGQTCASRSGHARSRDRCGQRGMYHGGGRGGRVRSGEARRTGKGQPGRMGSVQHSRTADAAGWPAGHRKRAGARDAVPLDRAS